MIITFYIYLRATYKYSQLQYVHYKCYLYKMLYVYPALFLMINTFSSETTKSISFSWSFFFRSILSTSLCAQHPLIDFDAFYFISLRQNNIHFKHQFLTVFLAISKKSYYVLSVLGGVAVYHRYIPIFTTQYCFILFRQ